MKKTFCSPTAFRLGVPISLHGLFLTWWPNFGQVNGGSMSYIAATSSLHRRRNYIVNAIFFCGLFFSFARATEVV